MKNFMYKLSANLQVLIANEEGQDLVEYALLIALVSLAAVAALNVLATDINGVFTTVSNKLAAASK